MFFVVSKTQQATHPVDPRLPNPKNPGNPMTLRTYRTQARWAVATVNSKKVAAEFYDSVTNQKIPRTAWSVHMKAFALEVADAVPKPPFVFRITVIGWIAVALLVVGFGGLAYQEFKPVEQTAEQIAMEQAPAAGDVYFGRFENAPEPGSLAASSGLGFGWFQVVGVDGDTYLVAKSTDMSPAYQPKEQLASTDFENESVPTTIVEQEAWGITLEAVDGSVTFSFTDKK